jgi:hypothetical protein
MLYFVENMSETIIICSIMLAIITGNVLQSTAASELFQFVKSICHV